MFLFLEKDMRSGVSYICKRYSKAKNKCLKPYEPKQESKRIIYLNANNLYGYVMSQFLPTIGLKLIDSKEFEINKHTCNS